MKNSFASFHLDFIGFTASLICAIHCAAIPVLLIFSPFATLAFFHHPAIELTIVVISFCIAAISLFYSYNRYHKSIMPLSVASLGFVIIGSGHSISHEWMEISLTVVGAILISVAHFLNWKNIHRSEKSNSFSMSASNKGKNVEQAYPKTKTN